MCDPTLGAAFSDASGSHHVRALLDATGTFEDSDALLAYHGHLLQSRLLRMFYTRDLMMGPAARYGWVEPMPLPVLQRGLERP